jgi:uncharacterized delta-60 repeat protein
LALTLIVWLLIYILPNRVQAAEGDLDPTFGSGGKVTTDFFGSFEEAHALAIQTDGKIVAVGLAGNGTGEVFALARYNSDGSLDTTFGTGGKVTTDFGGTVAAASAMAIQTDGKIVAVGFAGNSSGGDFVVARYNADGSLDPTFGIGGKVTTDYFGDFDQALAVAIQADGKITAAGAAFGGGATSHYALARYISDGSLDTTFGVGGRITTDFFGSDTRAFALTIQSDGKIVAAGGTCLTCFGDEDLTLARYNIDGSLDTTFGTGGKVTTDFYGFSDEADALAIQSDGKIVAAGFTKVADGSLDDFAVARYNTDGSLDMTFGNGGKSSTDFFGDSDFAVAMTIQPDGKIIAAGQAAITGSNEVLALVRYNSDGSLDATFGVVGKVTTDFFGTFSQANSIILDPTGRIVATGYAAGEDSVTDFALARYLTNTVVAQTTSDNPTVQLSVQSSAITIEYPSISSNGYTLVTPLDTSATANFSLSENLGAYDISTTATFAASAAQPITICFTVPSVSDQATFDNLRVFHVVGGGVVVDATSSHDFSTRTVCATATSLSPFVIVKGAVDQLSDLIALVRSFNLRRGIENSLDAKLQDAQNALTAAKAGDRASACNSMGSFINEVRAQTGSLLTQAQGSQLVAAANQIKVVLACPR